MKGSTRITDSRAASDCLRSVDQKMVLARGPYVHIAAKFYATRQFEATRDCYLAWRVEPSVPSRALLQTTDAVQLIGNSRRRSVHR